MNAKNELTKETGNTGQVKLIKNMTKKTVIKWTLKFAPLKSDFQQTSSNDKTSKTEFDVDMSEVVPEDIIDVEEGEVIETSDK